MKRALPLCAASILLLAIGCSSSRPSLSGSNHAVTLYVVENGTAGSSVLELPAGDGGSVAPTNTVSIPFQTTFDALAVDTSGNLYVSASVSTFPTLYEILVYAPGATGTAAPTSMLTSASLTAPLSSIAVDATGAIYALSGDTISVFAANASGNATPVRQIAGSLAQLDSASSIAVDAAQNIYVANTAGNDILVFDSSATGNVAPTGILAGAATQIAAPTSVAVDSAGDIYVSSFNQPSNSSLLLQFAPAATGNLAPTRTLTGEAANSLYGLAVDSADYLFTVSQIPASGQLSVDEFSPTATGGNPPALTTSSTAWTASTYNQIAVR